jgi:hypothetical protein
MAGCERRPREPAGQMRESGGSSTGHNRETTGRADDHSLTKGRSPLPPPLTDHTIGASPVALPLTDHTIGRGPLPPPLTDHTKRRRPIDPDPPEGASRQIEPASLPGQGSAAAG